MPARTVLSDSAPLDVRIDPLIAIPVARELLGCGGTMIYVKPKNKSAFSRPKRITQRSIRWKSSEILTYRDALLDWQSQAEAAKAIRAERMPGKASCVGGADDDGVE